MQNTDKTLTIPVLERDNGAMPVLGLGTWEARGETCRHMVTAALRMGYRHVDTARMYENETAVGAGIRDSGVSRDELFVTTKLQMGKLDAAGVRESCENSLRDLGMDYVDLLLIHWPEPSPPLTETLGAMARLREEGRIRDLGLSNFTVPLLEEAIHATEVPI